MFANILLLEAHAYFGWKRVFDPWLREWNNAWTDTARKEERWEPLPTYGDTVEMVQNNDGVIQGEVLWSIGVDFCLQSNI